MRLGIMQPYFFPYPGHFALIARVDRWLVFDITQYTPKTWMNRNRILHPQGGWSYITAALANSSISIRTCAAQLLDPDATCRIVLGKLSHYRRTAPYYRQVTNLVTRAFDERSDDRLVSLNVAGLCKICDYLKLPFDFQVCSELEIGLPDNLGAGLWAPTLCSRLGAVEYLNPIGGRHLFNRADFEGLGVQLKLLDFKGLRYPTGPYVFEPQLSILDALMWQSPDQIRCALHTHARMIDGFPAPTSR